MTNRTNWTSLILTFLLLFLGACGSTMEETEVQECQPQNTESCAEAEDNGEDRGYDPCKINKNLPVCKDDG